VLVEMVKKRQITIDLESLSEEVIYKYGDYHAGFRELLQNAADAIEDYKDYYGRKDKKFNGTIRVALFPSFITVWDNGIGLASKEINQYLLRLYGTDKKGRDRAGIFGRGFFAIFKEASQVYVFTRRPKRDRVFLKVYPDKKWFSCDEISLDEIPSEFRKFVSDLSEHGTLLIVISKGRKFPIKEIEDYLRKTCVFFDIPLYINGARINKTFREAIEENPMNRAIVDFDESDILDDNKRINGCLAYQTSNNMIQAFVHNIKVLNLISPVDSVCGYINYNKLQVVPSRDALVQNEDYYFFINVLTRKCDEVMKKLSRNPQKDDYQALLNYAISKKSHIYVWNARIYQMSGQSERITLEKVVELARPKKIIFFSEKRNLIVDRLRKRDYLVLINPSERELDIIRMIAAKNQFEIHNAISDFARKKAGLGNRVMIPEDRMTTLERKTLKLAQEMTDLKVLIMEGDEVDEAEHIKGEIRIQRNSRIFNLAKKAINYPFICKFLLSPLISHEISHENGLDVHDEEFYTKFEVSLRELNEKILKDFLEAEIKKLHST